MATSARLTHFTNAKGDHNQVNHRDYYKGPLAHEGKSEISWCVQCGLEGRPVAAVGWDEDGEPACVGHRKKADRPLVIEPPAPVTVEVVQPANTQKEETQMPLTVEFDLEKAKSMHAAGHRLREIAVALGVSLGTVSRKLSEAGLEQTAGRPRTRSAHSISNNRGYVLSLNSGEVDQLLQDAISRLDTDQKLELLREVLLRKN